MNNRNIGKAVTQPSKTQLKKLLNIPFNRNGDEDKVFKKIQSMPGNSRKKLWAMLYKSGIFPVAQNAGINPSTPLDSLNNLELMELADVIEARAFQIRHDFRLISGDGYAPGVPRFN